MLAICPGDTAGTSCCACPQNGHPADGGTHIFRSSLPIAIGIDSEHSESDPDFLDEDLFTIKAEAIKKIKKNENLYSPPWRGDGVGYYKIYSFFYISMTLYKRHILIM